MNVTEYHKNNMLSQTESDIFILERTQCIQQTLTSRSRPHLVVAHTCEKNTLQIPWV